MSAGSDTLEALEKTLPKAFYVDPAHFDLERGAIFLKEWFCVGRTSSLTAPGDYLACRVAGESVLIVRGENGALRAFYNVCRHRGAELVPLPDNEIVKGTFKRSIVCPYHAWRYQFDGALRGAPHLNLTPGVTQLHPIAVDSWGGFVFVDLSGNAGSLLDALGDGVRRVARYPLADLEVAASIEYRVSANWKVLLENYNECYHCGPVHPELCELVPAFRSAGASDLDWDSGVAHRAGATTFTWSGTTDRPPFPGLSDAEKTHHKGELFYPNLMLSLAMDHVAAFSIWPTAANETLVRCDFLFHPETIKQATFNGSDAVDFWDLVNRQDWSICESVQRGMQSLVFDHGYYAPMEDYSLDIRRYVLDRVGR
jgi:Rieske 2Fe-2S family protein|tara:strand:+ start:1736 stop:2842 length:1107 start_codon:yes stop_codon:yes gene_type:complete